MESCFGRQREGHVSNTYGSHGVWIQKSTVAVAARKTQGKVHHDEFSVIVAFSVVGTIHGAECDAGGIVHRSTEDCVEVSSRVFGERLGEAG